jgi:tRNA1Val (adenine37-N6)-methyltransferase
MPNSYFKFKQFTIWQEHCAMKVGTDGVLLGAWTDTKGAGRILDIGTGSGLIALMLAQRSDGIIDAIEIDESAVRQANDNFNASPWKSRINGIHCSFQNFDKMSVKYNIIVSNPPYFSDCLPAPDLKRTIARHNAQLSTIDLIDGVVKLLHAEGRFSIILPVNEFEIFKTLAEKGNLFENRRTLILPSPDKPVKRILSEWSFQNKSKLINSLVIEQYGRHRYSEEFIALTREYYLKL